jgi:uncharacterized protein (DUF305 family)
MSNRFIIALIMCIESSFIFSCNDNDNVTYKAATDTSVHSGSMKMDTGNVKSNTNTMSEMQGMKMTGDFDLDFANTMIVHHQAAIDMSEVEIVKGTDEKIKTMARNIIEAQKAEIKQMQQFVRKYKIPKVKMQMSERLDAAMKTMKEKMNGMKMTGNADKDFVIMMIPHHESAVVMAQDELVHGKQPELKKMAQKMIADQRREINELQLWISAQK